MEADDFKKIEDMYKQLEHNGHSRVSGNPGISGGIFIDAFTGYGVKGVL
jgi:hypothetical protein